MDVEAVKLILLMVAAVVVLGLSHSCAVGP
jgi:hypothetical protein